jgi:hypothetical protein
MFFCAAKVRLMVFEKITLLLFKNKVVVRYSSVTPEQTTRI